MVDRFGNQRVTINRIWRSLRDYCFTIKECLPRAYTFEAVDIKEIISIPYVREEDPHDDQEEPLVQPEENLPQEQEKEIPSKNKRGNRDVYAIVINQKSRATTVYLPDGKQGFYLCDKKDKFNKFKRIVKALANAYGIDSIKDALE